MGAHVIDLDIYFEYIENNDMIFWIIMGFFYVVIVWVTLNLFANVKPLLMLSATTNNVISKDYLSWPITFFDGITAMTKTKYLQKLMLKSQKPRDRGHLGSILCFFSEIYQGKGKYFMFTIRLKYQQFELQCRRQLALNPMLKCRQWKIEIHGCITLKLTAPTMWNSH